MTQLLNTQRTSPEDVAGWTDKYFTRTKDTVADNPPIVTYGVFVRRPTLMATRLAEEWLRAVARDQGFPIDIKTNYEEGAEVGAGDPLMFITGRMDHLAETETHFLQKIGPACVAAMNARDMCITLPKVPFLAMDVRHDAGMEMAEMMAYAASVGSRAAQQSKEQAIGFVGNATDATAHFFGNEAGFGTMPHALIGAFDSTLEATKAFRRANPDAPLTVLVDFHGMEVTDALAVCNYYPELAAKGEIGIRLDTHGGRYLEGLDPAESYAVLERNAPDAVRGYRSEEDLKHLTGTGVSAAAIWYMREQLDKNGFPKVKIVASSGFNAGKCRAMTYADAPIDMVGTGSFLPSKWSETYATADVICYDGEFKVKVGREFLIKNYQDSYGINQPRLEM